MVTPKELRKINESDTDFEEMSDREKRLWLDAFIAERTDNGSSIEESIEYANEVYLDES